MGTLQSLAIEQTLSNINHQLEEHGKSLEDFSLPVPTDHGSEVFHELEKWAPKQNMLAAQALLKINQMNHDQQFFLKIYYMPFSTINHLLPSLPVVLAAVNLSLSRQLSITFDLKVSSQSPLPHQLSLLKYTPVVKQPILFLRSRSFYPKKLLSFQLNNSLDSCKQIQQIFRVTHHS